MNRDYEDLAGLDPWEMLGVDRDADPIAIKRAHRQWTRTAHTDIGGDNGDQVRLNLARDVLLDPVRRKDYADRMRREARGAEGAESGGDSGVTDAAPDEPPPAYEDRFEWESGAGPSLDDLRLDETLSHGTTPHDVEPEFEMFVDPPTPTPTQPRYQPYPQSPPPYPQSPPPYPRYQPYPQQPPPYRPAAVVPPLNTLALTAIIMSSISCCSPFTLVSIPLAIVALAQIRRRNERGAILAWLAIIIGGVILTLQVAILTANA